MKPEEISAFISQNQDLFGPGLGQLPVIDTDDIQKLLQRLFMSPEYKAFIKRERWQRGKDLLDAAWVNANVIKGIALTPSELDKPEFVDKWGVAVDRASTAEGCDSSF